MQRHHDEDPVDRMLRQALPGHMSSRDPGACTDAETMAAWTEGALPASEAARVETHLAGCARCQALLATLVRTQADAAPGGDPSLWQRWRLRSLVPIAAAATTVAIWTAVPREQLTEVPPALERQSAPEAAGRGDFVNAGPDSNAALPEAGAANRQQQAAQRPAEADAVPGQPRANEAPSTSVTPLRERADAALRDQDQTGLQALAAGNAAAARAEAVAPAEAPATSPPAAASPTAAGDRRELALERQAAPPVEIVSPEPATRWRILNGTRVERSTTGGSAWEAAVVSAPAEFTAGSSPGPLVCWLVGRGGAVSVSTDGLRFETIPPPDPADLIAVSATSAASAVVTTADGRSFRTNDRGATWTPVVP